MRPTFAASSESDGRPIPVKTINPSQPRLETRSARWFSSLAAAAIVAAGLAAYSDTFRGAFVFDDSSSITANPTIRHLWPPWDVLATPRANVTVQGRPVLNLSFAINYAIGGSPGWCFPFLNVFISLS